MFSRMKPEKPAGVRSGFLRARNAGLVAVDEIGVLDVRPHDLQVADPVWMGDVRADGPHADRKHRPDQGEGPRTRLLLPEAGEQAGACRRAGAVRPRAADVPGVASFLDR